MEEELDGGRELRGVDERRERRGEERGLSC